MTAPPMVVVFFFSTALLPVLLLLLICCCSSSSLRNTYCSTWNTTSWLFDPNFVASSSLDSPCDELPRRLRMKSQTSSNSSGLMLRRHLALIASCFEPILGARLPPPPPPPPPPTTPAAGPITYEDTGRPDEPGPIAAAAALLRCMDGEDAEDEEE